MLENETLKFVQVKLQSYIRSIVFNQTDTEDIIQEVNLILLKKREFYDPSKSLLSWAMTIARFQIKKYLTNKKRYNSRYINYEHEDFPNIRDPFYYIVKKEFKELDSEIESYLSKMQYEIYNLLTKGYKVSEIALKMSICPARVSRSKSAMIIRLKQFFLDKKYKEYSY